MANRQKAYFQLALSMRGKDIDALIGLNLQRLINKVGTSQNKLAEMIGVPPTLINQIIKGKKGMGKDIQARICNALNVEPYEFYLEFSETKPTIRIPVLLKIPPGFPDNVSEEIIEYISLPDVPKNTYAIIIKGDSMSPVIKEGDYALFMLKNDIKDGDVVIVTDEWNEAMAKRYRLKGKEAYLTSDNPEYPSFKLNEHHGNKIIGKVIDIWSRRKP